ncbi:type III secretion system (T3SS) SseB-like protein [Micromonospora sp. M71_S20]|uniref:SseB family protein n=1 Tax=Micromonospora sp. M71_S20 TaxID=592872 RepID=UPI000EAEB45C|nr:SseB family protein [Micromonospora sp. M71_S20]RLK25167.1 type III secretion system (T3SS) SseB-like protein [Micromonospora sp. M71_S20]
MTSPGWPEIVARLHDTLSGCDRDTDLELAAGPRRLHLMVRRDTVRGVCPPYDEPRLAELGWQAPRGAGGWWYETPRTAEGLRWWSGFAARTAATVLTTEPGALSCQILPPTGPRVRPEPTVPPVPRVRAAEPVAGAGQPGAEAAQPGAEAAQPAAGAAQPAAEAEPAAGAGTARVPAPPPADLPEEPPADLPAEPPSGLPMYPAADGARDGADAGGPSVLDLLSEAGARRDLPGYLGILAAAAVCVPLAAEPGPDRDVPWTIVTDPTGAPLLPVFTSPEALTVFAGEGVPFVAVPCADLLANWPDPAWGLVVDAGTPRALALGASSLAALLAANPPTD